MLGALVDGLIPLAAGIYATLLGMRKVGKRPGVDAAYDEKMAKLEKPLKILGPFVTLFWFGVIDSRHLLGRVEIRPVNSPSAHQRSFLIRRLTPRISMILRNSWV